MNKVTITGHKVVGGKVEGRALVSKAPICFLNTVQPTGLVAEKGHPLEGQNIGGTILVYPCARDSTVSAYRIYEASISGHAPKAILINRADSITISGAVLAQIPMVHKFDKDPIALIQTGDYVTVDADAGIITITKE